MVLTFMLVFGGSKAEDLESGDYYYDNDYEYANVAGGQPGKKPTKNRDIEAIVHDDNFNGITVNYAITIHYLFV